MISKRKDDDRKMETIRVQFITDYVCPFCYVAKKIFLEAAKDFDVQVEWISFESTLPDQPREDVFHNMAKKRQYKKEISPYVKKYSIPIHLPPAVIPRPYTRFAALGGLYAEEHGHREVYDQAVTDAYFLEEADIGQEEVLLSIAEQAGLDRAGFTAALHSDALIRRLEEKERKVLEELSPKTLPTIIMDGAVRLEGGIYTLEKYRQFLERADKKEVAAKISIEEPVFFRDGETEEDFAELQIFKGQGCSIKGCY
ncbi:MAG: DsbA family protein [Sarcina sp.]|nr:DsbA family protein [Sarcina sp.]